MSRSVRAAMKPSIVVGEDGTNGGLWCSPVAKTSRPTSSAFSAIRTIAWIRSASDGTRPVVGSGVTSPTEKTPNCMPPPKIVEVSIILANAAVGGGIPGASRGRPRPRDDQSRSGRPGGTGRAGRAGRARRRTRGDGTARGRLAAALRPGPGRGLGAGNVRARPDRLDLQGDRDLVAEHDLVPLERDVELDAEVAAADGRGRGEARPGAAPGIRADAVELGQQPDGTGDVLDRQVAVHVEAGGARPAADCGAFH